MKNIFEFKFTLALGPFQKDIEINSISSRLGIMGPSGCGKSSLARSLVGIDFFSEGEIKFKNLSYSKVKPWERNFAYLPQNLMLLPHLTVKENILFPKNSTLVDEVLNGFEINHLLKRMPRNLSGGEKQRVALSRALCSKSALLILDEPFSSLDIKSKESAIGFLNDYASKINLPMIVISHGEEELKALNCEIVSLDSSLKK
ncbi:MAG: ATP-binding cassette domain-containing protein [Bdellovibrionales bacterium]|nr:ATP-binding cassette domain-containing protein [Bdellovibrionales bacterium]